MQKLTEIRQMTQKFLQQQPEDWLCRRQRDVRDDVEIYLALSEVTYTKRISKFVLNELKSEKQRRTLEHAKPVRAHSILEPVRKRLKHLQHADEDQIDESLKDAAKRLDGPAITVLIEFADLQDRAAAKAAEKDSLKDLKQFEEELRRESLPSDIERINRTPMEQLRFGEFAQLRSGRDEFSRFKLTDLKRQVSASDCECAEVEFHDDDKGVAMCLRWVLRGLNIDKAIRKVRTDQEVSQNAASSRR